MWKVLLVPLALIAIALGAISWSAGSRQRADFAFINRGDIITLDLNQMSYMQDFRIAYGIREGLFSPDPVTLVATPAGAESCDISPDGRVYTFHLRPNAKWTNGDPVRAQDYLFSWRRFLQEPGEYTYLFYYVKNAKAYEDSYTKGRPIDFATVGIEAPDPLTFRVTLNDPVPYLLDLVAFPPFYPRHERSMAEFRDFAEADTMDAVAASLASTGENIAKLTGGELLARMKALVEEKSSLTPTQVTTVKAMVDAGCVKYTFRNEYTKPPKVVTNGPFSLTRWAFKRSLFLTKSETYWDKANIKLNTIEMVSNDNVLSQQMQYEAGVVDWLADVPTDLVRDLKNKGRADLRTAKAFGTAFVTVLSTEKLPASHGGGKNPFFDKRVRQALAMSIDKEAITREITGMGEEVATRFVPPGTLPGYEQQPGLPFDVAKAKQLLADAGYPGGKDFPVLPMIYRSNNPTQERLVQYLAKQWSTTLGIEFELKQLESKMFRNKVSEKDYVIGPAAWYGDYPDVSTFTDKYLSTSLQNDCGWVNPEFDSLCAAAAKEPNAAKRLAILDNAEHLLNTEVPIIPIYYYVNISMSRDNVHGCLPNARGTFVFKGVSIDR